MWNVAKGSDRKLTQYSQRTHEEMKEGMEQFDGFFHQLEKIGRIYFPQAAENACRSWKKARISSNQCVREDQTPTDQRDKANLCRLHCFEVKESLFECIKVLVNVPEQHAIYQQINEQVIPWLQSFSEDSMY